MNSDKNLYKSGGEDEDEWWQKRPSRRQHVATMQRLAGLAVATASKQASISFSSSNLQDFNVSNDATKHKRAPRKARVLTRDDNGKIVPFTPQMSSWYLTYVQMPPTSDVRFLLKFKRHFRLSFPAYLDLLHKLSALEHREYFD